MSQDWYEIFQVSVERSEGRTTYRFGFSATALTLLCIAVVVRCFWQ